MIAPILPYGIRGAIWYQGERNARTVDSSKLYAHQLPLMINDWRRRWGQGDFPFLWVQLPNFKTRNDDPNAVSAWAHMRESMAGTLALPNTGMATTIDIGEAKDIHPKNKQDAGARWRIGRSRSFTERRMSPRRGQCMPRTKMQRQSTVTRSVQTRGRFAGKRSAGGERFRVGGCG